ncbi:hypothetical protein FX985_02851 [Pseudomonas extremaustralis]|uniref:Uncharacterized protein n=1 Tax=Pseudomonas extremaustralis TaxID=359110 RepID=A0A5M9J4T5_9PSED|nr:hypothetical protein FX985_02851 [Pseudomonas extremaustralis]
MRASCNQQYHQRAFGFLRRLGWPHRHRFKSASAEAANEQPSSLWQDLFFRFLEVTI